MSILVEYTRAKHIEVENHPFVQYMLKGDITKDHYILFLRQFRKVYETIEYYGEMSGLISGLTDIKRSSYIRQDLVELGCAEQAIDHTEYLPSVKKYVDHIRDLYYSDKKDQIMAHIYVRHMGDLYGGKVIARIVPGSGKCYGFEDRPKLIKELNAKLSLDILDEALKAFDCSAYIFDEMMELINE